MDILRFKQNPFMAILRGVDMQHLPSLMVAINSAGWETLEITMNTPRAPELIQTAVQHAQGRFMVGAGTVLSVKDLHAALRAGATFIVTPIYQPEIVRACIQENVPVFPGALTPLEIWNAWQTGVTMIKVFPAKTLGPEYFKEIKGPFGQIELMACGGVTPENIKAYHAAGASAYAVGASVFKKEWLAAGEFEKITDALRKYQTAFRQIASNA